MSTGLNESCHCVALDEPALRARLDAALPAEASLPQLLSVREHLFAPYPVFCSPARLAAMQDVVRAVHEVLALPAFGQAPAVAAWPSQRTRGAMTAFDFHPHGEGVRLIEINTNAGGAYLAALEAASLRGGCEDGSVLQAAGDADAPLHWLGDFREEWRLARGEAPLRRVLIVDDAPESQFLYPEFLLFRALFRDDGIACEIADAAALAWDGRALLHAGEPVDMVYNRLTDFDLSAPAHGALRAALLHDAVVVTPSPRHHALMADKRQLVRLSDPGFLRAAGASERAIGVLAAGVPPARLVTPDAAEALWATRRDWFFKPAAGYASRGAYRGDKLTRRVWGEILAAGDYIAQALTPPALRRPLPGPDTAAMKFDLRCVSYGTAVRLVHARVYRGQTTNLRSPHGGLAAVLVPRDQRPEVSGSSPNHTTA